MKTTTATAVASDLGPLSRVVIKWTEIMERLARAVRPTAADWEPCKELVAINDFQRVGAYQEVMNWTQYITFLSEWAGTTKFEATVFRITEVGRVVFQEIEERHYKGDDFIRKNVIAVYAFDDANRIRHLDIYEQAKDTGRWIAEAAHASVK